MKLRIGTTTVILAMLAGFGTVARADDKAVRKEIEAGYKKLSAAMKAKDINGIMALGTVDFSMKQPGRPAQNGEQVKKEMEQNFAMAKSMSMSTKVKKLNVKGDTATAMTEMTGRMTMVDTQGMFGPKGKTHKMSDAGTSKDIWAKTPIGWKVKSVEVLTYKATMDGKPFDPMKAMGGGGAPAPPKKKK